MVDLDSVFAEGGLLAQAIGEYRFRPQQIEMARAVAEAEAALAAARREGLRLREELRAQGRAHLERELSRAREETTESIQTATGQIGEEAQRAAAELPRRVLELARGLAERVLGRRLAA